MPVVTKTYKDRIENYTNPAARALLETIERKRSNLSVSVDVTKAKDLLSIIDAVGPFVCLIKTHIDIIDDFEPSVISQLTELSTRHDFLIFEDRKFADIGNTVSLQYSSGVHKISSWAHITNAHPVPGPSVVTGLSSVGLPLGRGLLLLAEMSTKGTLTTGAYTKQAVEMARAHPDFVIGFIAQRRMEREGVSLRSPEDLEKEDFLVLTPGVALGTHGDGKGQQYRSPREVILESGSDVIIVGRGIYSSGDPAEIRNLAKKYREEGWAAYLERLGPTKSR